jgi:hypothetical protein
MPSPGRRRVAAALAEHLTRGRAWMAAAAVVAAPCVVSAQAPSKLSWTVITSDSTSTSWMDTTHIVTEPTKLVDGWYRVKAASEPKSTVVKYAIDCAGFRLAVRRSITYDGTGAVIVDESVPSQFYMPPPVRALQDFMHFVCRHAAK